MGMPSDWLIRQAKDEVIKNTGLDPEFVELFKFERDTFGAKFEFALYELDGTGVSVRYQDSTDTWYFNYVRGLLDEEVAKLIKEAK